MSEVYHGVLINADELSARTQFNSLKSECPLRLAAIGSDIYGYYLKQGEKNRGRGNSEKN